MEKPKPKPPILRNRRGIMLLIVGIATLFAVLYLAIGAMALMRTQDQDDPTTSSSHGTRPAQSE